MTTSANTCTTTTRTTTTRRDPSLNGTSAHTAPLTSPTPQAPSRYYRRRGLLMPKTNPHGKPGCLSGVARSARVVWCGVACGVRMRRDQVASGASQLQLLFSRIHAPRPSPTILHADHPTRTRIVTQPPRAAATHPKRRVCLFVGIACIAVC